MKAITDILLLIIIALCTWSGYKRGLIGGVASLLAIIIALLGGSIVSAAYSHEVVPAFEPFVDGYVDSSKMREQVLERMGYGDSDLSLEDILAGDSSLRYDYAYEVLCEVGMYEQRAAEMASESVELSNSSGMNMTDSIVAVLCDTITYLGAMCIGFLLLLILMVAVANMFNLSFRLPNMENLDEIGGAVLGFVEGFVYCVLISWVLSYLGLIIGRGTMEGTTLGRFFLLFDFITAGLM